MPRSEQRDQALAPRLDPGWHGLLLVLIATLLACLPALGNGFAQDDKAQVMVEGNDLEPNPLVADLHPLSEYFASSSWRNESEPSLMYRPLTTFSYALTRHALGRPPHDQALPQHALNVLLHLAATALVWRLLRDLRVRSGAALIGATVFGLHAVHAEVVAPIVGRGELLAFVFGAAGSLLGLRALRGRGGRRIAAGAGAMLCFFAAFTSKESALCWLPFVALLGLARTWRDEPGAAVWPSLRGPLLSALACAVLPAALFLGLRMRALAGIEAAPTVLHAVNPLFDADVSTRLMTAAVVWVYGLWKLCAPFWLVSDYGGQTFALRGTLDVAVLGSVAVLVALLVAVVLAARRAPLLALAGAAFLGFSFVTANVAMPIGTIFAERLCYAPSLAAALAAAWLGERAHVPRLLLIGGVAWLVLSMWVFSARLPDWRNDPTLLLVDVARNPRSSRLQTAAADVWRERGDVDAALAHYREAVGLDPEYADAWNNIGALLLDMRQTAAAIAALRSGIAARHANHAASFGLHVNLAHALLLQREAAAALAELEIARRIEPKYVPTLLLMLDAAAELRLDERIPEIVAAGEALQPGDPRWALHRGLLALRRGDAATAERELQAAIAGGVDQQRARTALQEARAAQRKGDKSGGR